MSMDKPNGELLVPASGSSLKYDIPAGAVVFLVALPLCLGIALASGTPMFAGIIAGIVGGIVIGTLSGSHVSVSGPAAGLTVIVLSALASIGSFRGFLVAVVISGLLQLVFGALKFGIIADYVPNSVIKGMLAGIGILIILKQIPHALGRDTDYEGDFKFLEVGGNDALSSIAHAVASASTGAVLIFVLGVAVLLVWEMLSKRSRFFQLVPGPLAVVVLGIGLNQLFRYFAPSMYLSSTDHLVTLPVVTSVSDFIGQFTFPDFSTIGNIAVWKAAGTIAVVGSLETLLSLEAADRLDPYKRISSSDRELRAQGVGNIISGLIGGLPVTSVVVRTAANAEAGARTRMSTIIHGLLLLASVIFLPRILSLTPLASLATILILVGFKLTKPELYRKVFSQGMDQFLPFIITVLAVVFTDLLTGVIVGVACGVFFVIRTNHHEAITVVHEGQNYLFRFTKDASFINKNEFRRKLRELPDGTHVIIDGTRALFIDHDIMEIVADFQLLAPYKNIQVDLTHWETQQPNGGSHGTSRKAAAGQ
jgi:MFS superfamily sulfate permease-like transporter